MCIWAYYFRVFASLRRQVYGGWIEEGRGGLIESRAKGWSRLALMRWEAGLSSCYYGAAGSGGGGPKRRPEHRQRSEETRETHRVLPDANIKLSTLSKSSTKSRDGVQGQ